jgi:hypothetical protein
MRNFALILLFAVPLLSFKCSEKQVNFIIENNSDLDVVFTPEIDFPYLLKQNKGYDYNEVKLIKKKSKIEFMIWESSLVDYSADLENYKFYFIKEIKNKDSIHFKRENDSLIIRREIIKIGEKETNKFVYNTKEILFFNVK